MTALQLFIIARQLKFFVCAPADVSYGYVVDQQPIGRVLFRQFCENNRPEFYRYVSFLENAAR